MSNFSPIPIKPDRLWLNYFRQRKNLWESGISGEWDRKKQQNDAWSGSLLSGMVLSIWVQQLDCWLYSTTYVINDAVNQSKLTSWSDTSVKTPLNNKKWMILLWIYVVKSSKYTIELRAHISEVCPTLI